VLIIWLWLAVEAEEAQIPVRKQAVVEAREVLELVLDYQFLLEQPIR
jgi:hypothetical protein